MTRWRPDLALDAGIVARAIDESAPGLDAVRTGVTKRWTGWDNEIWSLATGSDVDPLRAFRFTVRRFGIPLAERELAVLPRVAPLLTEIRVPEPVDHVSGAIDGHDGLRYPWYAFRSIPGSDAAVALARTGGSVLGGERVGRTLGRSLRRLHDPSTLDAVDPHARLPRDPNGRSDPVAIAARIDDVLAEHSGTFSPSQRDSMRCAGERTRSTVLPDSADAFVHGDLHLRNVIVDDGGGVAGLIDWGDCCRAHPVVDLAARWQLLDAEGRAAFDLEYGSVDPATEVVAHALALWLAAMIAVSSADLGSPAASRGAAQVVDRLVDDRP